jgi:hypothetical protein
MLFVIACAFVYGCIVYWKQPKSNSESPRKRRERNHYQWWW